MDLRLSSGVPALDLARTCAVLTEHRRKHRATFGSLIRLIRTS